MQLSEIFGLVGTFAAAVALVINRFGKLEARVGKLEVRVEKIEERLDRVEQRLYTLEKKVDEILFFLTHEFKRRKRKKLKHLHRKK